jgi:hypothetical protein
VGPEIPLEVWQAAIPWGHADYPRPVIFLGHRAGDRLVVLRVSSNLDLLGENDFLIPAEHPDFAQTGLKRASRVRREMIELRPEDFIKQRGALVGALRGQFEEWLQSGA